MPWKPLCDFLSPDSDKPCLDDAPITVQVEFEDRTYKALLCKTHGQALVNAGEPVSLPKASSNVVKVPTAKASKKGRTAALREWAAEQNPPIQLNKTKQNPDHIAAFEKATGQSYWQ